MNIKKKIQNSWLNPELPDVCLKKDQLDFSKEKEYLFLLGLMFYQYLV